MGFALRVIPLFPALSLLLFLLVARAVAADFDETAQIIAGDPGEGDDFGGAVAVDGGLTLVGAYLDDDNGDCSGSAYLFRFDRSDWVQEQKVTPADGAAEDEFGEHVALQGDVALLGAKRNDDDGMESGSAYIYRFDGSTWIEEQKVLPSDGAFR